MSANEPMLRVTVEWVRPSTEGDEVLSPSQQFLTTPEEAKEMKIPHPRRPLILKRAHAPILGWD